MATLILVAETVYQVWMASLHGFLPSPTSVSRTLLLMLGAFILFNVFYLVFVFKRRIDIAVPVADVP